MNVPHIYIHAAPLVHHLLLMVGGLWLTLAVVISVSIWLTNKGW